MSENNGDNTESQWLLFDAPEDVSADLVSSQSVAMTAELLRELKPGHELFGTQFRVIGRRWGQDDILLVVDGRDGYASVHLSYGAAEIPPYPRTEWYSSIDSAVAAMSD